jgi:lysozyme
MDRQALAALLEKDEGVRLRPYLDTEDQLTIGIGRCLDTRGITLDEARYLLQNDIDECLADLEPLPWFQHLSDIRQRVICAMRFNLGMAGLMAFKRMLVHLEAGRYTSAARELLNSEAARQTRGRYDRLATMMITDQELDA